MSDKRTHRGPHPQDARLFASGQWPALRCAVSDLSWLLSHGYAMDSALKLVGDHLQLDARQRIAVMRCACCDTSLALRRNHELPVAALADQRLLLDGYNVLTTIEAALGGGVLLRGRDGCLRDMASMHGHYKRVAETASALELIGQSLAQLRVVRAEFLLDAPVSNSGRLKTIMMALARERGWPWQVTLVPDPDPLLACSTEVVATADSAILDGARNPVGTDAPQWTNFTWHVISTCVPTATIVCLQS